VRTVFVTGATGAIGSELTRGMLAEDGTRVRLLLRARSPEHLNSRLLDLFRFWNLDPHDPSISQRIEAFAGDVTLPRFGLDEKTWTRLADEVTHVIHSAGNVKLNRPMEEARRSAVDPISHIVTFIESSRRHGVFQKLDYVSTVGVGGRMAGTLPERPLHEPRTFRNSYEAAKAEAETFLLARMDSGLSATIHRPSMVVGHSRTGVIIQFQVFYHLCEFLSGQRTFGIIPDIRGFQLDIIPVDYVARAIQLSSLRNDASGRVFHLCSGGESPALTDLSRMVRQRFEAAGRPTPPPLRTIPSAIMRALVPIAGWCVGSSARRALRSLPYFLDYLDSPPTFANENTCAYFSAAGITLPHPDSYLDAVLSYYLARPL
jgi:thioester reductase-like protein